MRELLNQRRRKFLKRCLSYLPYVCNDHFILVVLVFLGFVALEYRQLLLQLPEESWPLWCLLLAVSVYFQTRGRLAVYVERPDTVFLLPKEAELLSYVQVAKWRSFLVWAILHLLVQLFLLPLYRAVGLPLFGWLAWVLFLTACRYVFYQRLLVSLLPQGRINWDRLLEFEQGRQQGILRFFALFTNVKGLASPLKKRIYWNSLLPRGKYSHATSWDYLYVRAYLRAGEFFPLTLRLLAISCVICVGIDTTWLAVGLLALVHYLLLFQLLGLYRHYDYQYLVQLYPLAKTDRKSSFTRVLLRILRRFGLCQAFLLLLFVADKGQVVYFGLMILWLHFLYLPIKLRKLID